MKKITFNIKDEKIMKLLAMMKARKRALAVEEALKIAIKDKTFQEKFVDPIFKDEIYKLFKE